MYVVSKLRRLFRRVRDSESVFFSGGVKVGQPLNPGFPLRDKGLVEVSLPLVVDGRILDSVQGKLLQVADVKLPG